MSTTWMRRLFMWLTLPGADAGLKPRSEPVRDTLAFEARLPSASAGLRFDASFTLEVALRKVKERERVRLLARLKRSVVETAYAEARAFDLGDHALAESELFQALNGSAYFEYSGVDELTVQVTLTVNEENYELERRRELVGQRAQLARAEHRSRMERVEELVNEVFKDSLTARMWWFEQNQDRWSDIEGAGEALDLLVALCRRGDDSEEPLVVEHDDGGATGGDGGAGPVEPSDPILAAFLSGVSTKEREALLIRLTDILDAYNRPDLVRLLHESWSEQ
ncbi:hypothetical protein NE857_13320 [Nocardiopsis exhalans]|uniref:UVR domain-containing protein n=1 Tax=Nocardiopsis exhalans TaxID=163604 RepID=A0ABY5DDT0_9ACTN|nr:hypothetical protein [Nocardiopsis exhalans]USY22499.1 hypothetical protein NE857_13320 [Nocardiopsis exhalans]